MHTSMWTAFPASLPTVIAPNPFRSFREGLATQVLDPSSTTNVLLRQSSTLMPLAIAVVGQFVGVAALFSKPTPVVIGMTRRKPPGDTSLSDEEFEDAWLNGLSLSPEFGSLDDVREIETRIARKSVSGASMARLWKVLGEIGANTDDEAVRSAVLEIHQRLQKIYERGLERLRSPRVSGDRRSLWRGLRNSLEKKEYDHMADFVIALLRENEGRVNYRLIQYPHPAVRSFVYSFLLAFGHNEKIREFWKEFEETLFREDIETNDPEIRRFTVGVLGPVLAAGTQQELASVLLLHAVLRNGSADEIKRTVKKIALSPSGREGTALGCLIGCLMNPDDAYLRFIARAVLNTLADQLEVREKP